MGQKLKAWLWVEVLQQESWVLLGSDSYFQMRTFSEVSMLLISSSIIH